MSSRDQRAMLAAYCGSVSQMCGLWVAWAELLWIVSVSERRDKSCVGSNSEGPTFDCSSRSHCIACSSGADLAAASHTTPCQLSATMMASGESLLNGPRESQTREIVTPDFDIFQPCTCMERPAWLMVLCMHSTKQVSSAEICISA